MSSAATLVILVLTILPYAPVFAADLGVKACKTLSSAVSNSSQVYWPGSLEYASANSHWVNSSSIDSACAIEPGTTQDVATIIKILGSIRVPFGVKSGGHATNRGFSATNGVQVSLSRFSKVKYDQVTSTVRVGAGLVWDDVYAALEPHGVIVVGGRVSGVGVGGFATGGGYSWKSNQFGLAVDNVVAYDLVLPNGTFVVVTETSHHDLFFGLKGGYNNFGIVTGFTLKAFPQTQVWGGLVTYSGEQFDAIAKATANFSANNKDPKAALITTYNIFQGTPLVFLLLFYDAPDVANGVFDEFLAVPSLNQDISTRTYSSLITSVSGGDGLGSIRGTFHSVSLLRFSKNLIDVIINENNFWGSKLPASGVLISYAIEPFHGHSTHATASAYPHDTPLLPLNLSYFWPNSTQDHTFITTIKESVQRIYEAALAEGQDISIEQGKQIRYPNYALSDTPLEQMYGTNVHKLKSLRALYDPKKVMYLTGGFKF